MNKLVRVSILVFVCIILIGSIIATVRFGIALCRKQNGVKTPVVAAVEAVTPQTTNATDNVIMVTTTISPAVSTDRFDIVANNSNSNVEVSASVGVITITKAVESTNFVVVRPSERNESTNTLVTETEVAGTVSFVAKLSNTYQVVTAIVAVDANNATTSSNATLTNMTTTSASCTAQAAVAASSKVVSQNTTATTKTNPATRFTVGVGVVAPNGGDVEKGKIGFEADILIPVYGPLSLEAELVRFGDHLEAVDMTTLKMGASIVLGLERGMWYGYGKIGLDYNQIDFFTEFDGIDISVEGAFGQHFGAGIGCSFANRFGVLFDFTSYRLETTARVWGNGVSETVGGSYNHNLLKFAVTYRF